MHLKSVVCFIVLAVPIVWSNIALAALDKLMSEDIVHFTGTYQATHRKSQYTLIIQAINPAQDKFIVAGFFDEHKATFFDSLGKILSKDNNAIKQGICHTLATVFCSPERLPNQAADESCMNRNTLAIAADYYLAIPSEFGMLFILDKTGEKLGDYFEHFKGNAFLPKKEYVVSDWILNDKQELAAIRFKETGYIQFFTTATIKFKKHSSATVASLTKYADLSHAIDTWIQKNSQSICQF